MPTAKYPVPVDTKTIASRLREVRKRRSLTQVELAEQMGMRQALLSDYERGRLRLHGGLVVAFAKVLRVTADELLGIKAPARNGVVHDRRFVRRLEQIDQLPKSEKQVLLKTIDRFLGGAQAASRREPK